MTRPSRGAYGRELGDCFGLGSAPSFVSRTLQPSELAVTLISCGAANNGRTAPVAREDAPLVTLQLRDCAAHELCLDGRAAATAPLEAGTACVYDLRRELVVNSIRPFRTCTSTCRAPRSTP